MSPRLLHDKPTVFVVDRDPTAVAELLRAATDLGFLSAEWSDVEDYFAESPSDPHGCLLIDYATADMSPEDFFARLEARRSYLPVVFLWLRCDVSLVVQAMKAGALDGLKKPCPPPMLAETIRGAMAFDAEQHQARLDAARCRRRLARLGADERRLLAMLTGGLANKDIAFELNVCLRTAEDRRAKLMAKMKAQTLTELLRQAICGSRCGSRRIEFVADVPQRRGS